MLLLSVSTNGLGVSSKSILTHLKWNLNPNYTPTLHKNATEVSGYEFVSERKVVEVFFTQVLLRKRQKADLQFYMPKVRKPVQACNSERDNGNIITEEHQNPWLQYAQSIDAEVNDRI